MKIYTANNMKRVFGVIFGLVILAAAVVPQGLLAQSDPGALHLTTSPLPITLKAKPGEAVETEIRIRNGGTKTEMLKVGLMKFTAYGEDGKPRLKERENGDDYFDWATFSKTEFTAPPGEWQTIKMKIALPKTAAFGYYYAVTFSRTNPVQGSGQNTGVRGGTAVLVLLEADVPGAKREASIESFQVSKRTYEFLPAAFSVRVKNTGNIHTAPTGTIFIKRGDKQVAIVDVNTTRGNILPDSSRIFDAQWKDGFPIYEVKEEGGKVVLKDGQPVQDLSWDLSKVRNLRFGKYSATIVMVYDDGERDVPMEATVSFWVIPWRLIIIGLLVPLAPAAAVYLIMRHRLKRKLTEKTHVKKH
jgi:hypothetical protein